MAGEISGLNHPVDLVIASGPCPVSVPNVVDMTEAAAGAALQANDLRLGAVTRECTDTAGAGAIIRQNPAAGEAVARGTQVSLAVSEGRCIPSVEVPDFTGGAWPLADALAELDTLGLLKGAVAETCHDTAAPGMIISQNPAPGTMVAEGTEVDFETATGPCGYTLNVAKMGGGHGTVSGGGTDCGAVCSQAHPSGAQVLLTATAGAGSVFAGWTGADETSGNTCLLVMDSDRTVWAQFASAAGNTLVVTKTGNGSGTVTGNGINCGGDCSQTYGLPTNVTLTATPAKGSVFTGFTGHDSEGIFGDNLCAVYVDCVREVTANFTTTPRRLDVVNGGGGTVTGLGINCGGNCSADYSENATVRLSAEPDELHEFVQWIGADNAAGASCTVLMDTDREVTAVFRLKTFTLGMNAEGFGRVNARVTGYYLGCNMHCERQFPAGSMVSLTATPDSGQSFTGWDGVDTQDGTAATVFMDGEREVTAFFSSVQYTLTARSSGEGAVSAPGLSCAASPCSGTYNANQVVLVSASPAEGWRFGGWNGVEDGTANPCAVNMNADRDITAVFLRETVTYPLTVITEGDGLIKVNPLMPGAGCPPPDGCVFTYDAGETASLYALPQAGSLFGGWGGDLAGIIPWGSLIMDGPKTVHAAFVPQSANFTLTVQKSGGGAGTVTGRRIGGAEDEIDCGAACSHSFPSGTTVSLSAVPEAGSVWGGWTGGTAAGTACNVVMSGDKTVTATFLPAGTVKRRLTVQVIGSGSVASTPAGILCGSNDSQAYEFAENTNVTLAATPSSGWSFSSWGMDASGNSGTVTVAMSGDRDVVAYFGTTSTVGFTHDVKYDLLSLKINGADQFTPGAQYIPCGVPPFSFPAQAGQGITVQAGFGVGATGTLYWTHTGTITAPEGGVAAYPPFSLTIGEYLREATIRNGQPLGACVYEGFDDFATPSVTYTLTVNAPAPGVPEFILSGGGQSWSGALSAPLWGCNDQIVKFYFGGNMPAHCNTTTYPQVQMTGGGPIGLHIISPNQVTQRIMAMWKKP
ncbi:MAG: PASTA domain-containing protein [Candidatus Hydrogenedens sp.]|nr:PASTA domain-containing protein [Candidatus Hydrogenedens sp.]